MTHAIFLSKTHVNIWSHKQFSYDSSKIKIKNGEKQNEKQKTKQKVTVLKLQNH